MSDSCISVVPPQADAKPRSIPVHTERKGGCDGNCALCKARNAGDRGART